MTTPEEWRCLSLRIDYLHGRRQRREGRARLWSRVVYWGWALAIPNVVILAACRYLLGDLW